MQLWKRVHSFGRDTVNSTKQISYKKLTSSQTLLVLHVLFMSSFSLVPRPSTRYDSADQESISRSWGTSNARDVRTWTWVRPGFLHPRNHEACVPWWTKVSTKVIISNKKFATIDLATEKHGGRELLRLMTCFICSSINLYSLQGDAIIVLFNFTLISFAKNFLFTHINYQQKHNFMNNKGRCLIWGGTPKLVCFH